MTENRRQFSRIRFQRPAALQLGEDEIPVEVLDLSLKGALIRVHRWIFIQMGSNGTLDVVLDDQTSVIRMDVTVVHHQGETYGLACREIDIDSVTHLRRLVELNIGDSTLLERELSRFAAAD